MLVKSLLLAVIFSVMCIASSASTTVEAYSVKFNNGSELTLDPKYFTGSFPNIQQNGLAPNTYAWELSLLAASNFNGACSSSYYAAQGASCDQTVFPDGPTSTLPNSDGTGVQIILQTNFGGNPWQATYNVICDPTATTLKSPSNAYQASRPATTIVVAFTMTSAGACLGGSGPGPNPPPPGPPGGGDDGGKKSGLTWGGVFMIIFWVPLALYIFGMIGWNYYKEKRGWELAPHPDFWKSLPILAKDGVTFLVSKARGTAWTPSDLPEGGSSSGSAGGTESAAGGASGGYAAV